jgi:hypothetical protein
MQIFAKKHKCKHLFSMVSKNAQGTNAFLYIREYVLLLAVFRNDSVLHFLIFQFPINLGMGGHPPTGWCLRTLLLR